MRGDFRLFRLTSGASKLILSGICLTLAIGCFLTLTKRAGFFGRHDNSELQGKMRANFKNNISKFYELKNYVKTMKPFPEITFQEKDVIECNIRSYGFTDSLPVFVITDPLPPQKLEKITIAQGDSIVLGLSDTVVTVHNWFWQFEGGKSNTGYGAVVDYLGLSQFELDSLRVLLKSINCKAVSIDENHDIRLRFYGNALCSYEYLVTENVKNRNYTHLDKDFYVGINVDELFCGTCD